MTMKEILAVLAGVIVVFMIKSFAVATMWNWFVHPLLAVPRLTIFYALGLMTMLSLLSPKRTTVTSLEDFVKFARNSIPEILIAMGFGWTFHLFI